jgi:hypothetical protein
MTERKRRITGTGLIVVGALFLFVTNRILIGWEHIWPLFVMAVGTFSLRSFWSRGNANYLFGGLVGLFLGFFLLLFSVGILDWTRMAVLWPTVPLVVGGSLLAAQVSRPERGTIILEVGIVAFGLIAFLFTTERINPRVAAPFLHFWPLVLIVAGVAVLKMRADRDGVPAGPDPDMEAMRAVMGDDEPAADVAPAEEKARDADPTSV